MAAALCLFAFMVLILAVAVVELAVIAAAHWIAQRRPQRRARGVVIDPTVWRLSDDTDPWDWT